MIPPGADLGSAPVAARKRKGFVWQAVRACQGQHTVQDAHCVSAMPKGNKKGRKAMKAYITLALVKGPAVLRVAMIVISLVAMAMGSGAADDWGGSSGWIIRR
jgi:hypothetical protein